ncbi:Adenylyl cyclase [Thalictrum thalictroides]|uniref:Adenylyl cyclase n=1 Tax=Thalictrum thalictroides TaxID=46969 RepID=A0A7J6X6T1_THATH|nr:Adenylyl cyclase [Thalictrum thalictroides]
MQAVSNVRKLSRVLITTPHLLLPSHRFLLLPDHENVEPSLQTTSQSQNHRSFSVQISNLFGISNGTQVPVGTTASSAAQHLGTHPISATVARASYTSEATESTAGPTEDVKEIYDKMLKSVEGQTMPPNAWLWSLVAKCANQEDIALLFQMLQNLRRFRLSNLRIHDNFNCNLCFKVAEACARVGAVDYGKKALWEHNKYGLTPSVSSANYLLMYAKKHKDSKFMVEIMKLLKRNHLPLQPSTADIVFSICYDDDNWELISKYAHKFIKAGVKLRRTTFGTWMEFAAKRGDVESIWKIEQLRSKAMEKHNLATTFSCAKGFLLEGKPDNAAAIILVLNEKLPGEKRTGIATELQKLVSEWPLEVIKHQKEEDRKKLATSLRKDIPAMVNGLMSIGLEVKVNLNDLHNEEAIPC